jgi:pantetheine-phosphate adenylyltransferase
VRTAIYPGSFNPFHDGHLDVLDKSLMVFDKVIVAVGSNPDKPESDFKTRLDETKVRVQRCYESFPEIGKRVTVKGFAGLLVNFAKEQKAQAIVRGLRNGYDLQYEMNQQYWNEDLGLEIPTVFFIADRKVAHKSSTIYRQLEKFKTR